MPTSQELTTSTKDWIRSAKEKGKDNLWIEENLEKQGWPLEVAKKLIIDTVGLDQPKDPLGELQDLIKQAKEAGTSDDEIKAALRGSGWPEWKIDEIMSKFI